MKILLSPHNDDETLFSSFTVQREKPLVIVVFDSFMQVTRGATYCDWEARRRESIQALWQLHGHPGWTWPTERDIETLVKFCGFRDDAPVPPWMIADKIAEVAGKRPSHIWAPAFELGGHDQHNEVAQAAILLMSRWADKPELTQYLTYTRHSGKSRSGMPVPYTPQMIRRKHLALACYKSQIENPSTREWFMKDLEEYYA